MPFDPGDIDRPDAEAVEKKVRTRRFWRRVKAAASLAIAAAAGTFLACSGGDKHRPKAPPNPTTDEVSNLPDAGPDAAVDKDEHRKGMPVPDNLLE